MTSPDIWVDPKLPIDPFEQIRDQIARHIRGGQLGAGDRLPSIRQLAGDLRVAPGTVAKAYAALEADQLVTTSRGSGTRVRSGAALAPSVQAAAQAYVSSVAGVSLEAALAAVRAAWPGA